MNKPTLKLYVWPEFCPDYTMGLAFAIAETVQEAKSMVESKMGFFPSDWGRVEEHPISKIAFAVYGGG